MGRPKKTRGMKKQMRLAEEEEILLLKQWIESQKPDSGSNPLALGPLPERAKIGKLEDGVFSRYAGVTRFDQLPISDKTKRGLKEAKFVDLLDSQRAALPHALCGRDLLGAARTGSGKTLAFVIPVLETLHKERWGPEDGVGCIIISPTRELAAQTFTVLNKVGKFHKFSAGLLIGGREGVDVEKERVNEMNILVCAPGRLLQHMDETPNFECSNLKILILDEADRVLDSAFKGQLDPIISQLPKRRQTLLFSATQTKKVKDLARLSLRDPEYISVHAESVTATPTTLSQSVMIVPVEKKLDMLWSFIRTHLNDRILVFLSTKKQVKFVHEAFNKLRPGIPLKSIHGKMSQEKRMGVYSQFIDKQSVLFCTDVLERGLDFDQAVDWVVQVDCPDDVPSYIHRVGRTARCNTPGKSLLFLTPSEEKMVERLHEAKIPIKLIKVEDLVLCGRNLDLVSDLDGYVQQQANSDKVQEISRQLASLLVSFPDLQTVAQRAFITYLRSIHKRRDKEIFDVTKLSIEDFSASLGLPFTPRIRFANLKTKKKGVFESSIDIEPGNDDDDEDNVAAPRRVVKRKDLLGDDLEEEDFALRPNEEGKGGDKSNKDEGVPMPGTRVSKNKKLKISQHRPSGTRVKFDEEGNPVAPLAIVAASETETEVALDAEARNDYYKKLGEQLRKVDHEDKKVEKEKRREKRMKAKIKRKQGDMEEEEEEGDERSASSEEETGRKRKRAKKTYFDDNGDGEEGGKINTDSVSIAELEEMALKLITQS